MGKLGKELKSLDIQTRKHFLLSQGYSLLGGGRGQIQKIISHSVFKCLLKGSQQPLIFINGHYDNGIKQMP